MGRPRLSEAEKEQRRRVRVEARTSLPPTDSEDTLSSTTGQIVPLLRSEGQRMLLHVSGSLTAIANEIGARSPQSVLDWRNGKRIPAIEARARMQAVFGIPIVAWSQLPNTVSQPNAAAATSALADPNAPIPSTLESCLRLLATIQRDSGNPHLLAAERVKLVDAEARILKLRADLERNAELTEDRYVRDHPAWHKCKRAIAAALVPFPEAARAVCEALERIEM